MKSRRTATSARLTCLVLTWALLVAGTPAPPAVRAGAAGVTTSKAGGIARGRAKKPPATSSRKSSERAWRDAQVLVRLRPDASPGERDALLRSTDASYRRLIGTSELTLLTYGAGEDVEAAALSLNSNPAVEFAEPNYLITADQTTPNDPRLSEQWSLRGNDGSSGGAGAGIGVERAWGKTTGSRATVIAVVDGGVDFSHPDLRNSRWVNAAERIDGADDDNDGFADDAHGWDFVADSGEIRDELGHGTAVAGIIAAEGDNGTGTTGVMWRASLMSLRVLDDAGAGDVASAVQAVDYAVAHGAQVINCSWGMDRESRALRGAVERAAAKEVLVVASAGNSGRNVDGSPRYPASYDLANVVAVASSDRFSQLTPSSNWGASRVALAAPGAGLLTTSPGGGYRELSGTSAAAALVTGVAGLVKGLRPRLSAGRVRAVLNSGVRRRPSLDGKVSSGGLLDAAGALDALDSLPPDASEEGETGKGSGGNNGAGGKPGGSQGGVGVSAISTSGAVQGGTGASPKREPVRGRPGGSLPDLNVTRRHQPTRPQAPAPVRSTRRNCPPRNPRCNAASATASADRSRETVYVAALGSYAALRPAVRESMSLLDYVRGGTLSDSSPAVFTLPSLFLGARELLPSLYAAAAAQGTNGAQYVSQSVPAQMTAGQTYNVSVTMTNTGTNTWSPEAMYRLGAQNPQDNATWRFERAPLPTDVAPGATVTIPFTVTAPAVTTAAAVNFQWRMVHEYVTWFGDLTPNVSVTVTAPQYDGSLDAAGCSTIAGWAWDAARPNTPVEVDLFADGTFLTRAVADVYRADLVAAGKGDGRHGFGVQTPPALRDGGSHQITARYANTLFLPAGSPAIPNSPTLSGCTSGGASLNAPSNLTVTSASNAQIALSWGAPGGAVSGYRVERRQSVTAPYALISSPASAGFADTSVAAGVAYLYRVRAVSADGSYSPYGNVALGTAVTFADDPLVSYSENVTAATPVRAQHLYDLRQAVGAVRSLAGQPAAAWTNATLTGGVPIKAAHVSELRANLNQTLAVLGLRQASFTDPSLVAGAGGTPVKKVHVQELRSNSVGGSGGGYGSASSGGASAGADGARLLPRNRTGGGGGDLLSGNFGWGLPLVSLPGRAGLDLSLALSYNSLVWTRDDSDSSVTFDADGGFPGPGFRLGFPVIQPRFTSPQTGLQTYTLLTPGGGRVEFRQVGTSNVYDAADSSRLRLIESGGGLSLYTPDGSRLSYGDIADAYRCIQIEDRNGNLISVSYDGEGGILNVTDTLGRVVTFAYDDYHNPLSITQAWGAQTHTWATFGYGAVTVQHGFSGVIVRGPANGQAINVLTQVGLPDGSRYQFDYNPYGQVAKITRYSADNNQLAYAAYDYAGAAGDCPRVSARRDWALDWNNGAEAVTSYAYAGDYSWGAVTSPDQTLYKEFFATSGWQAGLTTSTEIWVGGVKQKYSETSWTQDDTNLSYPQNPRATSAHVGDADGNHRRTSVDYYTAAELNLSSNFGLVKEVKEYEADASAALEQSKVLRRTHTDYDFGPAFTSSRIIGLVSARYVYGKNPATGVEELSARTTYAYDETTEGRLQATPAAPTQHDANFGTGFAARGNLTSARRWSVKTPYDVTTNPEYVETKIGYDTAGSALFSVDPSNHRSEISYGDSFSDLVNRNTFAYATVATDPDQVGQQSPQRSLASYDFATGAVTRTQGLSPNVSLYATGPVQTITYDEVGRVARVERETDGNGSTLAQADRPHTRYVYSPGQTWAQVFTTIRDVNTEAYSIQVIDGAGRVYASASDFPGSTGHYRARHTVYDQMGRAVRASNPTEVDSSWTPAGDDVAGWNYALQDYDWKGRPTTSTAPGAALGRFSREFSYGGCGCAGGEVVTETDAVGRKQKLYHDVLGRSFKSEVLNPDGTTVYSTTTTTYNALDQATYTRTYQGAETSGVYQESTAEYDGHGRLWKSKAPSQTAVTTQTYNTDDTPHTVTDARGATATYTYNNNRHLVTGVSYAAPSSVATDKPNGTTPVAAVPSVTYQYDDVGNRKSMATGNGAGGSCTYAYDALSRMTSESRTLPGLAGTYTLAYQYTPTGILEKVTDQTAGTSFTTSYDGAGQITGVSGVGYNNTATQFASGMQYRAWGALKGASYGNGTSLSLGYDSRGQVSGYSVAGLRWAGVVPPSDPFALSGTFQYHADGALKFAGDTSDATHDRAYDYDHVGRLKEAYSGGEARAFRDGTGGGAADGPFRQSFAYDAWGNMLSGGGRYWSRSNTTTTSYDAQGRNPQWEYDAAGDLVSRNEEGPLGVAYQAARYGFDAAGRQSSVTQGRGYFDEATQQWVNNVYTNTQVYDGDGSLVRYTKARTVNGSPATPDVTYYLRSSVLGGAVVSEYKGGGAWAKSYVFAGGELIAEQSFRTEPQAAWNVWRFRDPVTGDEVDSNAGGDLLGRTALDPQGVNVAGGDPFPPDGSGDPDIFVQPDPSVVGAKGEGMAIPIEGGGAQCMLDGIMMNCGFVRGEAAQQCPTAGCGAHVQNVTARRGDGRVVATSSRIILPRQPGWDGSLDGTYRRGEVRSGDYSLVWNGGIFNRASGGGEVSPMGRFAMFFAPQSQQNSFIIGRFKFPQAQMNRLATAYDKIMSDRCRKWVNKTMEDLRDRRDPNFRYRPTNLEGLLAITSFNKYSPDLTHKDVGVPEKYWNQETHDIFAGKGGEKGGEYGLGYTLLPYRNQVFLSDNSFYIAQGFARWRYNDADLSGIIVHELFHVAGFNHDVIFGLNNDIQKYCGTPGDSL